MTQLPRADSQMVDSGGRPTRAFYEFFRSIGMGSLSDDAIAAIVGDISVIATVLGSEDGSVEGIPSGAGDYLPTSTLAMGLRSVVHYGALADGQITFALANDLAAPDSTSYYGTSSAGVRGWSAVSDAFLATTDITLTVDANGVTTVGLADLADAGGGEIRKFDRDDKGRVAGTSAATTDDLAEGATNLYYTDARADARVAVHTAEPDPHPQYVLASSLASLTDASDDTAAAGAGVAVGDMYRTGSTLKVRIT